mmetsp:Transcript_62060/g.171999  ORF Transcript_62060/g.171999 Transcript_62060/m.171999 type:complete len:419 (-) Transcript_62060:133-1389(-)|eukprot:CAMPEP_0179067656 /NCGR_PEP_ID=MMETSP0796-20121207/29600_1 /TAXON_ID=73915 /ORGANISM="Pyrodinium bahamense, Strain pbaha01" /LENGTH=418 /DNA_ID=CAMNT_0020764689 /DNA_START=94 /DNA_END=1350 /DNA_ORIENTATION=+
MALHTLCRAPLLLLTWPLSSALGQDSVGRAVQDALAVDDACAVPAEGSGACRLELLQRHSVESLHQEPPSGADCSLAPECVKLKLEGNCCPNDAGIRLGCCPGGGDVLPPPDYSDIPADSKQRCENNALCKDEGLQGLCCPPTPNGTDILCCDSVLAKADDLQLDVPLPELKPAAETPGPLMTFYMYRAQNDQNYPLNGVNMANLEGDIWYLHNEVVFACPRKFNISRITRYRVTMRATKELFGQGRNFDGFAAFDKAKCTVPGCSKLHWEPFGYVVGCQKGDTTRVALPGSPAWYSLPGTCPSKFYFQKAETCIKAEPGGECGKDEVTGTKDCTYHMEEAGELRLDDLSGIKKYNENCAVTGQREYDEATDKGTGTSFWDGKLDVAKGAERKKRFLELFAQKYPQWPANYDEPECDA